MISFTPTNDDVGEHPITVTVSDAEESASTTFTLTVMNVNDPPVLTAIPDTTISEKETLMLTLKGEDIDGDVLSYGALDLPRGAELDAGTGQFRWRPDFDQAGEYRLTFTVTDGELSDSQACILTVENTNLGDASGNGVVTAFDGSLILRHKVKSVVLAGWDSVRADVSGNGTISAYDASLVLQYVVGIISQFPVEGGAQARLMPFSRTVGIPRVGSTPEGYLTVPVSIDRMEGVLSGEMVVSFDPDQLEAISVVPSPLLGEYLTEQNVTDGKVRVAFAGAESGEGSGDVLEVTFRPVGEFVEALRGIRLECVQLNEGQVAVKLMNGGMPDVPTLYVLYPSFPNPFNAETTIRYGVPMPGRVLLVVYNMSGQKMRELVSGSQDAGMHTVMWDGTDDAGRDVASGVYLCRMEAGEYRAVRKLVLVR